jgi:preprotein translocase subunit SecE
LAQERHSREPRRENVPGELDHASGDAEQVEARIVSGAEGEPLDEADAAGLEAAALAASGPRREVAAATTGGGPAFVRFLRASWAELQRVQWPNRQQVLQATAVVLGFVVVAGAYLGVADWVAKKLVDLIL